MAAWQRPIARAHASALLLPWVQRWTAVVLHDCGVPRTDALAAGLPLPTSLVMEECSMTHERVWQGVRALREVRGAPSTCSTIHRP